MRSWQLDRDESSRPTTSPDRLARIYIGNSSHLHAVTPPAIDEEGVRAGDRVVANAMASFESAREMKAIVEAMGASALSAGHLPRRGRVAAEDPEQVDLVGVGEDCSAVDDFLARRESEPRRASATCIREKRGAARWER
jgi:hypothetical protein